jgi:predicted ribosome quality control (RQC) complex YloA/Tae2 family protein
LEFLKLFKNKEFEPVLIKKDLKIIDIIPFKFEIYKNGDYIEVKKFAKSLEEFIDLKKLDVKKEIKSEKKIEKLKRQLIQQQEAVKKLKKEIELKKIEGDVIYLNYNHCDIILDEITNIIEQKDKSEGIKRINEKEIVKEFDPVENLLIVYLKDTNKDTIEVKLDFRKTATENAEIAYKDSKKYRKKLEGAQQSIVKTRKLIKEIVNKREIEIKDKKKKILTGKNFWYERFRWFISSEGNIIIGGKDAKSNDQVVKKYLKDGDRYAHADIQGAPSCVIKSKDQYDKELPISKQTLKEACIFAACYSKAWNQFTEAQAYWVLPQQVSKTPQSGEFVPKGAFIIRGKRNYYRCKLKIAIGDIKIDDTRKIMGGPVDAVKKISKRYVILVPGSMKKNVISDKLAKAFDINIDLMNKVIPPGGVSIVEAINLKINLEKG